MNNREKQVSKSLLKNELQVIKQLEKSYQEAIENINTIITNLMARKDTENLQSIIYQVKYQRALKKELEEFLKILQDNNFKTIDEYLKKCYEEGHIGTLFDLQGQGVPVIIDLDQEKMISAITLNSKLSSPLYTELGYNLEALKLELTRVISRGIASELSYQEIARNVKNSTNIDYNKSIRIARTEGHRIQCEATYNVQQKAIEMGAEVVKQWDSTLDGRTRPTHRMLDGQIVDIDEYFISNGNKALYPGSFGVAKEDCNCRCQALTRAKWGLTDEEFTKINGKTNELQHFENIKDYKKFKKNFWGVSK